MSTVYKIVEKKEGHERLLGLIDDDGNIVVTPQFYEIMFLSSDFFYVMDSYALENRRTGFLNMNQNALFMALPNSLSISGKYGEGLLAAYDETNDIWCFINRNGEVIQEIERRWHPHSGFKSGYALIVRRNPIDDDDFRFINSEGQTLLDKTFVHASAFNDGIAMVMIDDVHWYLNTDGELWTPEIGEIKIGNSEFSEGFAKVCLNSESKFDLPEYGIINSAGLLITNKSYWRIGSFHSGKCVVKEINGLEGVIDTNGEYLIEPRYKYIGNFRGKFAPCQRVDEKWIILSTDGEIELKHNFSNVGSFNGKIGSAMLDKKRVYIDIEGNIICPYELD